MHTRSNLPDPDLCRTQLVVNDLWECLVDLSRQVMVCRYALEFGHSHFCKHPENRLFGVKDELHGTPPQHEVRRF